ncbi:MAG: glycosyltransferase family 39 protein, partial [Magnetococcales bacterium]|nr:glycosyltransferase family 39 protein [Magnetococcales bacterium]
MTESDTTPEPATGSQRGILLLLLVLSVVLWFGLLDLRDLRDPDEGRYAEIPREMVASGDWITPRLNDFKYFEKPPLDYWGTAIAYKLFGVNQGASRLWGASLGWLGILWTFWLGRRLFGEAAGLYAAAFLQSSLLYFAMGHMHTLDMGTSVFMAFGLGALLLAQGRRDDAPFVRRWMLVAWGCLAAATLSKGPMGVILPAAAVTLYSLWQRDFILWRHLHLGRGLLLYLALTAPWFLLVSWRNPEFPEFFFIREHLLRYTTEIHSRNATVFYFLPVLLAGSLPLLARAVRVLIRPGFAWGPADAGSFAPLRLLWVYGVFIFLFFSFSHSKLIPYILPIFPPLALLVGRHLACDARVSLRLDLWILTGILALSAVILLWPTPFFANTRLSPAMIDHFRLAALGGWGVLALGTYLAYRQRHHLQTSLVILVAATLIAFPGINAAYQTTSSVYSARGLAAAIAPFAAAGSPVY